MDPGYFSYSLDVFYVTFLFISQGIMHGSFWWLIAISEYNVM